MSEERLGLSFESSLFGAVGVRKAAELTRMDCVLDMDVYML